MILDIHLEKCDDDGERLESLLKLDKPVIISLVPVLMLPEHEVFKKGIYSVNYSYPKKFMEIIRKHSSNKYLVFGQQGFSHYCVDCFNKKDQRDPWHENLCLYNEKKSVENQKKFIMHGKKIMQEILEISLKLYVPPNHQFDENTLNAVEGLDFKYFVIRNKIGLKPYREGKLIVLPENDLGEDGDIIYVHYDEMKNDIYKYTDIIKNSTFIQDIKPKNQSLEKILDNYNKILFSKKERDLRKLLK